MQSFDLKIQPWRARPGFTLVEMIVVIAIIAVLATAGMIGLGGTGGKSVTSAVATTESLFNEARELAVTKNLRTCVLIAKDLTNNSAENLRRMVVAYEETNDDGTAKDPNNATPNWTLSSRGVTLPEQTFFSQEFSKANHQGVSTPDYIATTSALTAAKAAYLGSYYVYVFNNQGICETPGTSVVIGSGSRNLKSSTDKPRVTSAGQRDFGGFVVWRNGQTSVFRNPSQISSSVPNLKAGTEF
jgi:prepilin-type N-terminal cleavage/methylation domain-containing protein